MNESHRATARDIAHRHLAAGDALGWFEELYARADGDAGIIPWADLAPNPNLVVWLAQQRAGPSGKKALKIGCGLGDDAEELARRGFDTTAFDISPTAINWCRRRFPDSSVNYIVMDLFDAPAHWNATYDFVLESYTLQVLPPDLRRRAVAKIASFVTPNGSLLVIARGRDLRDPEGIMPWPLTKDEFDGLADAGLIQVSFEDYLDQEDPPVRRFRAEYRRQQ